MENGYYDFATPFFAIEFTMEHLGLPAALQKNITMDYYEAGHMMYLDDAAASACTTTSPPYRSRHEGIGP